MISAQQERISYLNRVVSSRIAGFCVDQLSGNGVAVLLTICLAKPRGSIAQRSCQYQKVNIFVVKRDLRAIISQINVALMQGCEEEEFQTLREVQVSSSCEIYGKQCVIVGEHQPDPHVLAMPVGFQVTVSRDERLLKSVDSVALSS